MSNLASALDISYTIENKEMFSKSTGVISRVKTKLLSLYKSSHLPPLEWFINYKFFCNKSSKFDFIIEPGSRLILTRKKYIVYVENGLGFFSFNTRKINFFNLFLFKIKLRSNSLQGFVFYSKVAQRSTKMLFLKYGLIEHFNRLDLGVIYPFTNESKYSSIEKIGEYKKKECNILFCSSSFNLKGGRELLYACKKLSSKYSFKLNVVTRIEVIPSEYFSSEYSFCNFIEFKLSDLEYKKIIINSDFLVHPTYFDTHALSLLEGVVIGKPFIATNTFAIPEYIYGNNGIIVENPFEPYDSNGVHKFNGEALVYAEYLSNIKSPNKNLIDSLVLSISNMLDTYPKYVTVSNDEMKEFKDNYILRQWNEIFHELSVRNSF